MRIYIASAIASQGGSWGKALLWGTVLVAIIAFFTGEDHALDTIDKASHADRARIMHHDQKTLEELKP